VQLIGSWRRVGLVMGKTNFSDLQYHIQRNARDNASLIVRYSGARYVMFRTCWFIYVLFLALLSFLPKLRWR